MPFSEISIDLETITESEVSQKQKNKYRCGIQKDGADEPICKTEIETQKQRTNIWTLRGEDDGGMDWEIGIDVCTLLYVDQMAGAVLHCS